MLWKQIFVWTHKYALVLLLITLLLLPLGCFVSSTVSTNLLTPIVVPLIRRRRVILAIPWERSAGKCEKERALGPQPNVRTHHEQGGQEP